MANEIDIYSPRYLAEVVRQAPPLRRFFLDKFFTRHKTFTTERVDIDIVKGGRRMAAFVHPRVGGKVLNDAGYKTESYKPPLINPYTITTAEKFMTRMPGESLYSGMTPAQRAAQKLIEEYRALNDATTRREEWMAVQAIATGQIPIVGDGVDEVIDFGMKNKPVLSGTARWGQSGAKVLENLDEWVETVSVNGFANVDTAIMGKKAIKALRDDEKIQKMLDNRRMEIGRYEPKDLPGGVRYYGKLNDPNLEIYGYTEVYLDDWTNPEKPEIKPLIPDNAVILINSEADYTMAYGLCTYIDDTSKQWVSAQAERVLRSYAEHHPDRRMIELQAHPLPIPDKADSWLVATVC